MAPCGCHGSEHAAVELSPEAPEFTDFLAGLAVPESELAAMPIVSDGAHLKAREPEGVTYREVDWVACWESGANREICGSASQRAKGSAGPPTLVPMGSPISSPKLMVCHLIGTTGAFATPTPTAPCSRPPSPGHVQAQALPERLASSPWRWRQEPGSCCAA